MFRGRISVHGAPAVVGGADQVDNHLGCFSYFVTIPCVSSETSRNATIMVSLCRVGHSSWPQAVIAGAAYCCSHCSRNLQNYLPKVTLLLFAEHDTYISLADIDVAIVASRRAYSHTVWHIIYNDNHYLLYTVPRSVPPATFCNCSWSTVVGHQASFCPRGCHLGFSGDT